MDGQASTCCGYSEICAEGTCFMPTTSCFDNFACPDGQYCNLESHQCLPNPSFPDGGCTVQDLGGSDQFEPKLLYYWGVNDLKPSEFPNHINVIMAPMVADVNGDTIPEIVFNSWKSNSTEYETDGVLRIIRGDNGKLIASSNETEKTAPCGQIAIGRLYPDSVKQYNGLDVSGLQIVTCAEDQKLAAYNYKAQRIWKGTTDNMECNETGVSLADFDGDGTPELSARYKIYNAQTGELIAEPNISLPNIEISNLSVPADLDGDGLPELVGGNIAFKADLKNHILKPLYVLSDQPDGYPSIADLDLDGKPEIIVVRHQLYTDEAFEPLSHTIMAFRADGTPFWSKPVDVHLGKVHERGGSPATIARIDDDPHPSILVSSGHDFIALDYKGNLKWSRGIGDKSSRRTGSTVFDFNGDGKAEVVYADEYFMRVYDGNDGNTLFCLCNTSETLYEYPIVADVNNDGHAEIIVASNRYRTNKKCPTLEKVEGDVDQCIEDLLNGPAENRSGTNGIRVFGGNPISEDTAASRWMPTRPIYNQHAYSVTNVWDNGSIPTRPRSNWSTAQLNNFRQNIVPNASNYQSYLHLRPATISSTRLCQDPQPIYFSIYNDGQAAVPNGAHVLLEIYNSPVDSKPAYTHQSEIPALGVTEHVDYEINLHLNGLHDAYMRFTIIDGNVCQRSNVTEYTFHCDE